jgi:hypothetical protein
VDTVGLLELISGTQRNKNARSLPLLYLWQNSATLEQIKWSFHENNDDDDDVTE